MSIPARPVAPEAMAEARRLYETSRVSLREIAGLLGISRSTLAHRVVGWGWTPRSKRVPARQDAAQAEPPAPERRRALIARLARRIEAEIDGVERVLAKAGLGEGDSGAEAERAARTLSVLVRTLRELAALERAESSDDDGEAEIDADAYRRELAATLDRLLDGGAAR